MRSVGGSLVVLALFSSAAPQRLSAQTPLASVAQALAAAWQAHDFGQIIGNGRVEVRLPGVSASGPVPSDQADVLLRGYVRDDVEIDAAVASAMEVSEGSGYVQLRRSFRRSGGGGAIQETVLLGLERARTGGDGSGEWRVTVVQVTGSGGR